MWLTASGQSIIMHAIREFRIADESGDDTYMGPEPVRVGVGLNQLETPPYSKQAGWLGTPNRG